MFVEFVYFVNMVNREEMKLYIKIEKLNVGVDCGVLKYLCILMGKNVY